MYRVQTFQLIFMLLGGLMLLFVVAPLTGMVFATSANDLFETVKDKTVINSIKLTLLTSFGGTLFFSFLTIPFAYLMARKQFLGKKVIAAIIDLPMVIPHSAAGIAILGFISRDTIIGKAAEAMNFNLVGHPVGIAAAMAFVSLPYLFNAARDGFEAVPARLEKAALSLNATPFKVFVSISLPLASRSILSGFIMMFARGMSEFGAVIIVAYHPMTTPVMIYEWFTSFGLNYARPVAIIFIVVCLVFLVILRILVNDKVEKSNA